MDDFWELCTHWLPLNRKERFYTGTVFPALVCADNFAHFNRFLRLLNIQLPHDQPFIDNVNIQFFTEYSLHDSIFDPDTKASWTIGDALSVITDVPDIMILINGPTSPAPLLIAVEAKMFSLVSKNSLAAQLTSQRRLLNVLRKRWPALHIHHVALLPRQAIQEIETIGELQEVTIISWQEILTEFNLPSAQYFRSILTTALNKYPILVGLGEWGQNNDDYLSGQDIVKNFLKADFPFQTMGRFGGIDGSLLTADLTTEKWRNQTYEVAKSTVPANRNWFSIPQFFARVIEESLTAR